MKLDPYFMLNIKTNSKWIKGLNVRAKTVTLLENNMGIHLHDLR